MDPLIAKIILLAGAWKDTGCADVVIERKFQSKLNELKRVKNLTHDQAVNLIILETSRKVKVNAFS